MKKKNIQDITVFIPVTHLAAIWKGEFNKLPANKTFNLIVEYPVEYKLNFPIKTGKTGLGLVRLLGKIGKIYEKIYQNPDKYGVVSHGIYDLCLEGLTVNLKKQRD